MIDMWTAWRGPVLVLLVAVFVSVCAAPPPFYIPNAFPNSNSNSATFTLDLLHTAQLYGNIGPVTVNGTSPGTQCTQAETVANVAKCASAASGYAAGGLARLATYVNAARQAYQQTPTWSVNAAKPVLIDAGDVMFYSMLYNALGATPFPPLLAQLGVDIITHGLTDMIQSVQVTAQFDDALPGSIPIVISNIAASHDEWLGSHRPNATYHSNSTIKYDLFHIMDLPINGNSSTTVKVGFVGCMWELTNGQASVGENIQIDTDPEGSVRLAVQRMQHVYPSVTVVVMISSCSPAVNERLARNIVELDVIIENGPLYSNTESNVVASYPKVITNNIQTPCLLVSAGQLGARVGHLAVQFDANGQAVSWLGDSILLTSDYLPNPPMLSQVNTLMSATTDYTNRVVGSSLHDIGVTDCRRQQCSLADLANDALLWYCKDCNVAIQNGGGFNFPLLTSARGNNVTIGDLYTLQPYTNNVATFYLTGAILLKSLQIGLDPIASSLTQVSGMRYAFNPDPSLDVSVRISEVQIWSNFAQDYVPLVLTQLYKVVTSDYLAGGGEGHTELITHGQQMNKYGPNMRDVYHNYISQNSPLNGTKQEDINAYCANVTYTLEMKQGKTLWPNSMCRIIRVSSAQDLLTKCPTSSISFGQEVYDGMKAGETLVNSTIHSCSGLGICSLQQCTCGVATTGVYAGLKMIRGQDCSDVRREYKFSSSGRIALIVLSSFVILLSLFTSVFYAVYHNHRVVRASSPLFMHIACIGTLLVASSVIISLSALSNSVCAAQYWTLAIGFGLTFGSLFAKTYRLYRIFNQRAIKLVAITNRKVISIVMFVLIVELIILMVFQVMAPLTLTGAIMEDEQPWSYTVQCSSSQGASFAIALLSFNCFLLLIGTFLSWELRHIDGTFNETKYLGMAIYNTAMVTVIVLPLVYVFHDTYPTFVMAFRSIFILYCATFVLLIITVPKYIKIRAGQGKKTKHSQPSAAHKGSHEKTEGETPGTMNSGYKRASLRGSTSFAGVITSYGGGGDSSMHEKSSMDDSGSTLHHPLPKLRAGDLMSRTDILQELLSDMSTDRKVARLDRHVANVEQHLAELKKTRQQLRDELEGKGRGHGHGKTASGQSHGRCLSNINRRASNGSITETDQGTHAIQLNKSAAAVGAGAGAGVVTASARRPRSSSGSSSMSFATDQAQAHAHAHTDIPIHHSNPPSSSPHTNVLSSDTSNSTPVAAVLAGPSSAPTTIPPRGSSCSSSSSTSPPPLVMAESVDSVIPSRRLSSGVKVPPAVNFV